MNTDYDRIEKAILYLQAHFKEQPHLDEIAAHIHLSPFHFQRLFTQWAGLSPKRFLQFLNVEYAKKLLKNGSSLQQVSYETGLSSVSRLHDLFVTIEGMSPGTYKNGAASLPIDYHFESTIFGEVLIASTENGICFLNFVKERQLTLEQLFACYPNACFMAKTTDIQQNALRIFSNDWTNLNQVKLHLKGTNFQLKVWHSLLQIPFGSVSTYAGIAAQIVNEKAFRAVGTAVGKNPVAFLIPCHRVIQSSGLFGQYHWGTVRKQAILAWEAAQLDIDMHKNSNN